MRNLNLDQLQTLIAIADLGTFAAAAQALHLAPPTVSLHIKELESRLDAVLVERGRRHAVLTLAGQALVDEGRKLLSTADDLTELVRRRASGRTGVVKVGVTAGVNTTLLPRMLAALAQQSPGAEVKLEIVSSAEALLRLRAGQLDLALVAMPSEPVDGVVLTSWRNDPMVAFLPSGWEVPEHVTPEWLASRRWSSFAAPTQMHGLIAGWFGRAGHNPRPFMAVNYPEALMSLALAGQSAVILPLELDACEVHGVQCCPLEPPLMRPMAIARRDTSDVTEVVRCVMDVVLGLGGGKA